jgi:hypothetical protein
MEAMKTKQDWLDEGWRACEEQSKAVCPFVEKVRNKLRTRAKHGLEKYGVTMDRKDLNLEDWLTLAQEEAMDFTVYIERIKQELRDLKNET